jgi:hypothetical protein
MHVFIYVSMYVYVYFYACLYACIHLRTFLCTHLYIYVGVHVHEFFCPTNWLVIQNDHVRRINRCSFICMLDFIPDIVDEDHDLETSFVPASRAIQLPQSACRCWCCCRRGRRCCDRCCTVGRVWCIASSFLTLLISAAAAVYLWLVLGGPGVTPTPLPPGGRVPDIPSAVSVATGRFDVIVQWTPPPDHGFAILVPLFRYALLLIFISSSCHGLVIVQCSLALGLTCRGTWFDLLLMEPLRSYGRHM